jgi:hypothetical protein
MIPVDQTRLNSPGANRPEEPPGNCFSACIASILELRLSEVPDELEFWTPRAHPRHSWVLYEQRMNSWLRDRGLIMLISPYAGCRYFGANESLDLYCVISGSSPRYPDWKHAVVGNIRGGQEARIVHDPHPSRAGLLGRQEDWQYELFVRHFNP